VGPGIDANVSTETLLFDRKRKDFLTIYNTGCCYLRDRFSPLSLLGIPGDTGQLSIEGQDACSLVWVNITGSGSFSSGNTGIATVGGGTGLATYVAPGSTTLTSNISYFRDTGLGECLLYRGVDNPPVTVNPALASFRISVTSTPVQGESNSVVSGQSAQVKVEALDNTGAVFAGYRGTARFSSGDATATLPADYTFTAGDAGAHTFDVTLKTVSGTTPTRDLTVRDINKNVSSTQNVFVWFQVTMDVELWKNCNFVSCPNLGSYFCQTAYEPAGWSQPTAFVALTQSSSALDGAMVTVRSGGSRQVAFVGDAGPVLNNPYWNTGVVPVFDGTNNSTKGGCLTDVLMTNLGISNGCKGTIAFGRSLIVWRFGN